MKIGRLRIGQMLSRLMNVTLKQFTLYVEQNLLSIVDFITPIHTIFLLNKQLCLKFLSDVGKHWSCLCSSQY